MKYNFYYDETEHSRKINLNTITANNFYDNFITVIVGWKESDEAELRSKYISFEEKYIDRHPNDELKSKTINNNQLRHGFASTVNDNVNFISDLFDFFSEKVYIFFSVSSKVEYIINQLFKGYKNSLLVDSDMLKYTIIKALNIYKPQKLFETICNEPEKTVIVLREFFRERNKKNKANLSLKELENESFEQILLLLSKIDTDICFDWNYDMSFEGFRKYIEEQALFDYSLMIDREGVNDNTVTAAKLSGLINVNDGDSKMHFGLRVADMLAGIIGKFMKSLCRAIHPTNIDVIHKTILQENWFILSEEQLSLYKKLHYIICELNNAWYKSYSGIFTDDLICFISLLNFMNNFENVSMIKNNLKMQGEYFNSYVCEILKKDFDKKRNKLPIDFIHSYSANDDFHYNRRGAKVYFNIKKQPRLIIDEQGVIYNVLSVGFDSNNVPLITIDELGKPICYRLPNELLSWAIDAVSFANLGDNVFPANVRFIKKCGKYYADIL